MWTSDSRVIAPWDKEQLESLESYQASVPATVKYTCINNATHPTLTVKETYLECDSCGYKVYWVWTIAVDETWRNKMTSSGRPKIASWKY